MTLLKPVPILISLLILCGSVIRNQETSKGTEKPDGLISGRVTFNGQPMPGVTVVLQSTASNAPTQVLPQAVADEEGRFRLTGILAGHYYLSALSPGLVVLNGPQSHWPGKEVVLTDGEKIEGLDLLLTRGGVISGQILDSKRRPLIRERVILTQIGEHGEKRPVLSSTASSFMYLTDDRGEYRLFGLPAGRYIVSVGTTGEISTAVSTVNKTYYPRTFYNNVTEESQASIIEVTPGSEQNKVDIVVMPPAKAQSVLVRIVDGATGHRVPDVLFRYGKLNSDNRSFRSVDRPIKVDANGEHIIENILPGRYTALLETSGSSGYYSDPVSFEVGSENSPPVEIKAFRGGEVSGIVIVEGINDQNILARLPSLPILAQMTSTQMAVASYPLSIKPDGSFQVSGLRPGRILFTLSPDLQSTFSISRIERDGIEQPKGIEVVLNEQVNGIRLILSNGLGSIRGQIQLVGRTLSISEKVFIFAHRIGESSEKIANVDADGKFTLQGLAPGNWEIRPVLFHFVGPGQPPQVSHPQSAQQIVAVANGKVSQVTIALDLKP